MAGLAIQSRHAASCRGIWAALDSVCLYRFIVEQCVLHCHNSLQGQLEALRGPGVYPAGAWCQYGQYKALALGIQTVLGAERGSPLPQADDCVSAAPEK